MAAKKFRGQKQIILVLNQDIYQRAGGYADPWSCPIATAIKKMFCNVDAQVTPHQCYINNVPYDILGDSGTCSMVMHARGENLEHVVVLNRHYRYW